MLARATRTKSRALLHRPLSSEAATSSSSSPTTSTLVLETKWKRPIQPGVVKAYDEALALIRKESNRKLRELQKIPEDKKELRGKLEIESQIDLPEVRWTYKQGDIQMSHPVHRYFEERKWRKEGRLDLLMERVHQMHVFPDVIPAMHPTVDLHVIFEKRDVEPGVMMLTRKTRTQPEIKATAFHAEEKLYTLIMVDPDVPDPLNKTYTTFLHMLQPNITLSATTTYNKTIDLANPLVPYVPPHPQKGTPYHRYTTLLIPQQSRLEIDATSIKREGFNTRGFLSQHGLDQEKVGMGMVPETYKEKVGYAIGGGIHMWREVWDSTVGSIYRHELHMPDEPTYGRLPKPDPYAGIPKSKYYSD